MATVIAWLIVEDSVEGFKGDEKGGQWQLHVTSYPPIDPKISHENWNLELRTRELAYKVYSCPKLK